MKYCKLLTHVCIPAIITTTPLIITSCGGNGGEVIVETLPEIKLPNIGSRSGTPVGITRTNKDGYVWNCESIFNGFEITNFNEEDWEKLTVYPLFSTTQDSGISDMKATILWEGGSHKTFSSIKVDFKCSNPLLAATEWTGALLFYWEDKIIAGDSGFNISITTDYAIAFSGFRSGGTHSTSISVGQPAYFGEDSYSWKFKSGSNEGFTSADFSNDGLKMLAINKTGATNIDLTFTMVFDDRPWGYQPILKVDTSGTLSVYAYTSFDIEFYWHSLPIIVLQGFTINFNWS